LENKEGDVKEVNGSGKEIGWKLPGHTCGFWSQMTGGTMEVGRKIHPRFDQKWSRRTRGS